MTVWKPIIKKNVEISSTHQLHLLPFKDNPSSKPLFEFSWKVIAIGYGCGFMIRVVVGKLWL